MTANSSSTLLLIDARLPQLETLLQGLAADVRPVLVPADADALALITQELATAPAERLALLAHGTPGRIALGRTPITTELLRAEATHIRAWNLSAIDLFSCQVAQDAAFVATLAELSGAAVQASQGLVGHAALGGSWQLQGAANAVVPFSRAALAQWRVTLATWPASVSITGYAEDTASGSIPATTLEGGVLVTANAARTTQGNWQYLAGNSWVNLATLSSGQSIFLGAGTQLRFAARADYYGTVGALSFRAYTGSTGLITGTTYSLTSQAGSYSSATYTASQGAITGVNDATQLSVISSLTYTEGAAAQILQGTAVVSDKDNLAGATPVQRIQTASVTVAANRLASDVLSYTGPSDFGPGKTVAASYDAGTGALSFTFDQPLLTSELQTVFRNVRYSNSSDDPTDLKSGVAKTTRTVTFSLTALSNDTSTAEAPVSSNTVIYLKTDNDGAAVSLAGPLSFSEQQGADSGANAIGFGASVSDADSTQFRALTFRYQNDSILNGAAEALSVVGAGGGFSGAALNAVGSNSVSLGTVAIAGATFAVSRSGAAGSTALVFQAVNSSTLANGTASEAAFNALLSALRYNNSSDNTTAGARNFSLQLTDSLGATAGAQAFTVVVSATNDIPEITVTPGADLTVADGSDTSASGSLGIADRDTNQSFFTAVANGVASYGTYAVSAAGVWTYALDEANSSVRALAEGESTTDTFTIVSVDGSASEVITITITGTNDAPVATFETAQNATEDGGSITGSVSSTDVDSDADPTYALEGAVAGLTFGGDGNWSFDASDAAYQGLAEGETQVLTATYSVSDSHGASDTASFTITVTGTNDAPVATFETAQNATEDGGSITGSVSSTDVDSDADPTYALEGVVAGLTFGGDGNWSFDASDAAYQGLAEGETQVLTATYSVSDSHGASDTASFTITVTGTNDAPVATFETAQNATEDGGSITGSVSSTDVDSDADPTYALEGAVAGLTFGGDGNWSFDASDAAYQGLAEGETQVLTATYSVSDSHGASDTASFTITVTGTNDAPVATFETAQNATEDGGSITGSVSSTDVDSDAAPTYALEGAVAGLTLGSDGNWSFDASDAAYQGLAEGETQVLTATYSVSDSYGASDTASFTITITGTNDAPVATFETAQNATEDGGSITGSVSSTDVDSDAAPTYALEGAVAGLTLGSDGNWSFDASDAAYQGLAEGETQVLTATYSVSDSYGASDTASFTITVTGTNDAPVATFETAQNATEDGGSITGSVSSTDVDSDAAPTYALEGAVAGLTLGSDGNWSFDASDAAYQGLAEGETQVLTATYSVSDSYGASDTASFTITVTGTNDAPVATFETAQNATEDGGSITGSVSSTDVDSDAAPTYALEGAVAGLTLGSDGNWSFDASDAAYQGLAEGETQVLTATYSVSDSHGASDTASFTITITGTNDTPVITGANSATLDEDAVTYVTSGSLAISDADVGESSFTVLTGIQVVSEVKKWWAVSEIIVFNPLLDNHDGIQSATIQEETTPGNWTTAVALTHDQIAIGENALSLNSIDWSKNVRIVSVYVDASGTSHTSIQSWDADIVLDNGNSYVAPSATQSNLSNPGTANLVATYGSFSFDETTGAWSYELDNNRPATTQLTVGATATDSLTVFSLDGSASEVITITITGANDPAESITGPLSGSVSLASTSASGTLTVADADFGEDRLEASGSQAGTYGTFTVDGAGSGWNYTLDTSLASFTALKTGETAVETFTVQASEISHELTTVQETVTITVSGQDDDAAISGDTTGVATEDTTDYITSGVLSIVDPDAGEAGFQDPGAALVGVYGTFTFDTGNGEWTYTVDNSEGSAADQLAIGDTVTDTLTVTSIDGTASEVITITITGANDPAASIDGELTGGVSISSTSTSGTVSVTDVDAGENALYPAAPETGDYGTFTVTGETTWAYTLDPTTTNFVDLAEGQTATDVFTLRPVEYGHSPADATATGEVIITVTGTNDTPEFSLQLADTASASFTESDAAGLTTSGTLTAVDPDSSDTLTALVHDVTIGGTGAASVPAELTASDNAALLAFLSVNGGSIDANVGDLNNVTWTFDSASEAFNFLAEGEELTLSYTVRVTDSSFSGAHADQTVTVTITGTNDAPEATFAAAQGVAEDATISGQLTASDADTGATQTFAQVGDVTGLTINSDGSWTFDAASYDSLETGVTQVLTATYSVTDNNDASATNSFTITVTGVNDAPVATFTAAQGVAEDATISGQLTASDADTGATQTFAQVGDVTGLTINSDGSWSFDAASYDSLDAGVTQVLTATYSVTDNNDASATNSFTITVTGVNDAPVATFTAAQGVAEDATISGQLTASDADTGATQTFAQVGDVTGLSINSDGSWSFDAASYDSLETGVTQVLTATYSVTDNNDASATNSFTITVTGVNDAPVATFTAAQGVAEDATISGQLTASDADTGATQTFAQVGDVTGLSINSDGSWSFDAASYDSLDAGVTQVLTATYSVTDNNDASATNSFTITVTGVNDAPVATFTAAQGVAEDATISGQLTASDADTGATQTFAQVGDVTGLSINSDGSWSFDAASYDSLDAGVTQVLTATYSVTDNNDASATNSFTITVTGVNDAPVATFTAAQGVAEDATISGQLTASDADTGATQTFAQVGDVTGLSINSDGSWSFDAASYDSLETGVTQVLTATYSVTDNNDASATNSFTITVTGVNDAPVATFTAAQGVAEDATISGQLTASDADTGATQTFAQVGDVTGLTINSDGSWSFDAASYDSLDAGVTQVLTATYSVTDNNDASATNSFTITVTGVNDAPVATFTAAQGVAEDATISGQLTASDADTGATQTFAQVGDVTGLTINSDGSWSFDAASYDSLETGVTQVLTATYSVTDNNDASATNSFTITVTGVNDAPVATFAAAQGVAEDATISGQLTASDADTGATQTFAQVGDVTGLTINSDGSWSFDAASYDSLDAGVTQVLTATYSVTDNNDASATNSFTITVTGVNDAPVATFTAAQGVAEDATISGQLTASDADTGATQTFAQVGDVTGLTINSDGSWSFDAASYDSLETGVTQVLTATYSVTDNNDASATNSFTITVTGVNDAPVATFTAAQGVAEDATISGQLTASDADTGATQTFAQVGDVTGLTINSDGSWSFDAASYDSLDAGVTQVLTATYSVTDNNDASATNSFTITVTGVNDAPVATFAAAQGVAEDATISGQLTASDADTGATQTFAQVGDVTGLSINSDGSWSFDAASYDSLETGVTQVLTATYSVTDNNDASATNSFTITVTGVNDAPVATFTAAQGVAEDATISGQLTASDADTGATQTFAQVGDVTGLSINSDGSWSFDAASYDSLDAGVTQVLTATYSVTDNNDASATNSFTITVTGVNDAPVATFTAAQGVAEDATISGQLTASDADTGATQTFAQVGDVTGLTINSDGSWSFDAASYDSLETGVTQVLTATYSVTDNNDASATNSFTITVTGVNDAPVATFTAAQGVAEDATISGQLTASDADTGATQTFAQVGDVTGLTINSDGSWSFDAASYDSLDAGVTQVLTATYSVTDNNDASATNSFTITVTGVNDAPVATFTAAQGVAEDATISGQLTASDADTGATQTFAQVGDVTGLSINSDGSWSFDAASYDSLETGVTQVLTATYSVTDNNDASATNSFTITVTGVNDAPVATFTAAQGVAEDATISGQLTASDADTGATQTFAQVGDVTGLSINSDGSWSFDAASYDSLDAGVTQVLTATYSVTDNNDASATNSFTITVTGVNDAPVATFAAAQGVAEDATISGQLTASDADTGATQTFAQVGDVTGLTINSDGSWSFDAASYDSLETGVTQVLTATYSVTDNNDASATNSFTITVTGVNDAPVATFTAAQGVAEDATISGQLTASDADTGATQTFAQVGDVTGLTINSDGSWSFDAASYDSLDAGVTQVLTATYSVTDNNDASATNSFTITVTGVNDAPVATFTAAQGVAEDATISGQLTASDADTGATQTFAQVGDVTGLTINSDGSWSFDAASYDSLETGVTQVLTATYSVTDNNDASATNSFTITVTGVNDAPVATFTAAQGVAEDATISGQLTASDADTGATQTFAQVGDVTGLTINSDGSWSFDAASYDSLDAGVTQVLTATYSVTDNNDASATNSFTITVTGVNDAPVATFTAAQGVAEDATISGQLTASDADTGATQTFAQVGDVTGLTINSDGSWSFDAASYDSLETGVTQVLTATYSVTDNNDASATNSFTITVTGVNDAPVATFTAAQGVAEDATISGQLTASDADTGATQTFAQVGDVTGLTINSDGSWSFDAASYDSLDAGVTQVLTATYSVTDNNDASATNSFTITVTGVNDAPVATFAAAQGVAEDATISGQLTASDADTGATQTFAQVGDVTGLTINSDGSWSFDAASYDSLETGVTQVLTATYSVTDNNDASATNSFTITVTGVNDAPVATFTAAQGVAEDATISGQLTASDADTGATQTFAQVGDVTGLTINSDGSWSFDAASYDSLDAGVTQVLTATYSVTDNNDASATNSFTITVTGVNDAPVATFTAAQGVAEDATISGQLTASDADTGATQTFAQVGDVTGLSINSDGSWSFDAASYDSLDAGVTQVLTATYSVTDNNDASATNSFTITVTGVNDAPVATFTAAQGVAEDATISGQLTASDADTGATQTFAQVGDVTGLTINSDGSWSFDAASYDSLETGVTQVLTATYSVTDNNDASATNSFTITVTGVNDAPVATFTAAQGVAEDATISGQLTASDADTGATQTFAQVGDVTGLTINSDGSWSFDAASYDSLDAGVTQVLTATYSVTDNNDASATNSFTITVTGVNDAPVATFTAAQGVAEDATISGQLTASDADTGATQTFAQVGDVTGLSINSDGSWSFDAASYDSLDAGVTQVLTATYSVTDNNDASATNSFTITVTGVNDAPVATFTAAQGVAEDATISGQLTASDADTGATQTFAQVGDVTGLTINSDGSWSFDAASYDSLDAGVTQVLTATYSVTDNNDASATNSFTITVTGVNDAPVATFTAAQGVAEDATISGQLTASDADTGATQTFAQVGDVTGLTINSDGSWSFDAASYDSLDAGVTQVLTATYSVTDNNDASATNSFTITVTGTNDTPEATYTTARNATEDGAVITGSVTSTDADTDASPTYALVGAPVAGLTFNANGSWSFDPSVAAYQHLKVGATSDVTVNYKVTDSHGASDTAAFVITVTGVNDAPVLSSTPTPPVVLQEASGIANATAGTSTSTVTISATDADTTPSADLPSPVFSATYLTDNGWALVSGNYTKAGTYGSATFNVSTGELTYTLDNNDADTQALQAGASVTESFTVAVTDLSSATTTRTTTFVIQGGNDRGVIAGTTSGSVTEKGGVSNGTAGVATASGDLNVDDPDGANDDVWTTATNATASYGTYSVTASGGWTYTLDDANATVQALNVGSTLTDSFVVSSADGGSTTISITINGANDTAVISGTSSGAVTEATAASAGTPSVSGTLSVADVDDSATFTAVAAGTATTNGYGTWGVTSGGVWTYNLDNANGTVQALNTGATLTDSFTVTSAGGSTQLITVTITGDNDAPYVSSTVHQNNGTYSYNGGATVTVNETTINSYEALSFSERDVFTFTGPTFADYEVGSLTRTLQASRDGGTTWVSLAAVLDTANAMPYLAYDSGANKVTVGRQFARTLNVTQDILLKFVATDAGSQSTASYAVLKYDNAAGQVTVTNSTNGTTPVYGIGGGDTAIYGTSDNDSISGTSGNDWIYAGPGDDAINAGSGSGDVLSYVYATGAVTVNYASTAGSGTVTGADGTDTFTSVEKIYGSGFNDVLNGNSSANQLFGGAGNDTIDGKAGNDTLQGGAGNDTITGGTGADNIDGGSGDDVLNFDYQDTVTGGSGADAFAFTGNPNSGLFAFINDYNWSDGDTFRLTASYTPADIAISYDADAGETQLKVSKAGDTFNGYTIASLNGDLSDLDSNGDPNGTTFNSLIASFRNASGGLYS